MHFGSDVSAGKGGLSAPRGSWDSASTTGQLQGPAGQWLWAAPPRALLQVAQEGSAGPPGPVSAPSAPTLYHQGLTSGPPARTGSTVVGPTQDSCGLLLQTFTLQAGSGGG